LNELSALKASLLGLPVLVGAAVYEEILYRGVLQAWLVRWLAPGRYAVGIAITVVSILWALAHAGNAEPLVYKLAQIFLIGIVLGWLARRYTVEAAIVAHATLNVVSTVAMLLIMGRAALEPGTPTSVPAPPPPPRCEASHEAGPADRERLLTLAGEHFAAPEWTRTEKTDAERSTVIWRRNERGAMVYAQYRVYACGYTTAEMQEYYREKNLQTFILSSYENLTRTATCLDVGRRLTLYEFKADVQESPFEVRLWTQWDTPTRVLEVFLVAPPTEKALLDQHAAALFPTLPACPRP
jgi:hypothetical protein